MRRTKVVLGLWNRKCTSVSVNSGSRALNSGSSSSTFISNYESTNLFQKRGAKWWTDWQDKQMRFHRLILLRNPTKSIKKPVISERRRRHLNRLAANRAKMERNQKEYEEAVSRRLAGEDPIEIYKSLTQKKRKTPAQSSDSTETLTQVVEGATKAPKEESSSTQKARRVEPTSVVKQKKGFLSGLFGGRQ
eukprot:TRINITY_DN12782_c0_g1_i1.p1 TRINITY_DN12782_c0_g1~~TRINITY_DN12782_c0_g1_i1.p1  ORF type:complete len:191 (-),score=36.81 TRINITY_DN12782_c0_g1_i1:11-583(-)